MPTYVYRCAKCGEQIEAFQSFADKPLTKHDECGGKLNKVLSAAGIVLKGSGFYKTDNRSGSSKGGNKERSKESAGAGSGTDSSSSSGTSSDSGSGTSSDTKSSSSSSDSGSGSSSGSEAKSA
jgi:putative FmdB family regulatory protein